MATIRIMTIKVKYSIRITPCLKKSEGGALCKEGANRLPCYGSFPYPKKVYMVSRFLSTHADCAHIAKRKGRQTAPRHIKSSRIRKRFKSIYTAKKPGVPGFQRVEKGITAIKYTARHAERLPKRRVGFCILRVGAVV